MGSIAFNAFASPRVSRPRKRIRCCSLGRRVLQRFKITDADPLPAATPSAEGQRQESPLSERETEILRLVAKGLNFDNIGGILEISPHTVVTHVKRIYRKLAVHSRGEAVYEARLLGLL